MQATDFSSFAARAQIYSRAMLLALLSTACGIQGGTEGDDSFACEYDMQPLEDTEAVPDGFDRAPRALLGSADGAFEGTVDGYDVILTFASDLATASASYDVTGDARCKPRMAAAGTVTLELRRGSTVASLSTHSSPLEFVDDAGLSSSVLAEVAAGSPLEAVMPEFSGQPLAPPTLSVALSFEDGESVSSEWRWSASVPCPPGAQCTGGPVPGSSVPPTGDEVDWGTATLMRER